LIFKKRFQNHENYVSTNFIMKLQMTFLQINREKF